MSKSRFLKQLLSTFKIARLQYLRFLNRSLRRRCINQVLHLSHQLLTILLKHLWTDIFTFTRTTLAINFNLLLLKTLTSLLFRISFRFIFIYKGLGLFLHLMQVLLESELLIQIMSKRTIGPTIFGLIVINKWKSFVIEGFLLDNGTWSGERN